MKQTEPTMCDVTKLKEFLRAQRLAQVTKKVA